MCPPGTVNMHFCGSFEAPHVNVHSFIHSSNTKQRNEGGRVVGGYGGGGGGGMRSFLTTRLMSTV